MKLRASTILAVSLIASAAHAAPPETIDPPGAASKEKLSGTVLVWADATFFTGPSEKSPSMQLATLAGSRRDHVGHAVPMRVVAAKGELIEVEAATPDGRSYETDCAWFGLGAGSDLGPLRLFVRRGDLAPVLTTTFSKTFDDGTSLKAQPGTPVVPLADGRYQVLLAPLAIRTTVPASSVGHAYARAFVKPTDAPLTWSLDSSVAVTLGGATVGLSGGPFLSESAKQQGPVTLFSFNQRCGQAVVAAPSKSVTAYKGSQELASLVGSGIGGGSGERWYLPAKTPLATAEGRVVTRSRGWITVDKPAAGAKQVCIERSLHIATNAIDAPALAKPATSTELRLCAPARLVKHDKGSQPGTLGPNDIFGGGNLPKSGVLRVH